MRFRDRRDAGRQLADRLADRWDSSVVVLALPRGGVPVGDEVARRLQAPLDVLVVRKIGHPRQPELALGAIGEGGMVVYNQRLLDEVRLHPTELDPITEQQRTEVARRVERYRGGMDPVEVTGRTVLVVDDGVATGSTIRAGIEVLRRREVTEIVVAVPVGAQASIRDLQQSADEVVCLDAPQHFMAVGSFYDDFTQVTDTQVEQILQGRTTN